MKRILILAATLFAAVTLNAQDFSKYLDKVSGAPFVVISKADFQLTLVGADGQAIKQYGCAVARNIGPKEKRGDHKTPEGTFKINELLNSKSIPHDSTTAKALSSEPTVPGSSALTFPASAISASTAHISLNLSDPVPQKAAYALRTRTYSTSNHESSSAPR